jgi:biuret amidohydrolase
MGVMAYRTAMAWQRTDDPTKVKPRFLRDSPGFGIVPELQPSPREAVFDKMGCPLSRERRSRQRFAIAG